MNYSNALFSEYFEKRIVPVIAGSGPAEGTRQKITNWIKSWCTLL